MVTLIGLLVLAVALMLTVAPELGIVCIVCGLLWIAVQYVRSRYTLERRSKMSRMMVHDRVMIELRRQGVTEAMLLECNDDQVALIVEMVDDKSFTGDYIKGVVSGYIGYNKHPITDDDIPDYVPKVMAKIHALEEVKNMTRS